MERGGGGMCYFREYFREMRDFAGLLIIYLQLANLIFDLVVISPVVVRQQQQRGRQCGEFEYNSVRGLVQCLRLGRKRDLRRPRCDLRAHKPVANLDIHVVCAKVGDGKGGGRQRSDGGRQGVALAVRDGLEESDSVGVVVDSSRDDGGGLGGCGIGRVHLAERHKGGGCGRAGDCCHLCVGGGVCVCGGGGEWRGCGGGSVCLGRLWGAYIIGGT